jgi:hypothetical protein
MHQKKEEYIGDCYGGNSSTLGVIEFPQFGKIHLFPTLVTTMISFCSTN